MKRDRVSKAVNVSVPEFKNKFSMAIPALFLSLLIFGCAPANFKNIAPSENEPVQDKNQVNDDLFFEMKQAQDYFQQEHLEDNVMTVSFQAFDEQGSYLAGLTPSDIEVFENAQPILNYQFGSEAINLGQKVDFVFVFDVTNSMQPTIDSAKRRVRGFVDELQKRNIQTNLCLLTFRDATAKKCDQMIEDNPNTPVNENLESFLSDLNNAKASGGGHTTENQLRALIDATETPWRANAQRIVLLITDAGFYAKPEKVSSEAPTAPTYKETIQAIQKSQMMVFAIAPDRPGYSEAYGSNLALPSVVGGEFFNYSKMIDGKISLQSIFNVIIDRIATQYRVEYGSDENLNVRPELPLDQRQVTLKMKKRPAGSIRVVSASSTWNSGRPEYKKAFTLTKVIRERDPQLQVAVNGRVLHSGYRVQRGQLIFDQAPPADAQIEVAYDSKNLSQHLNLKALTLPADTDLRSLDLILNGIKVPLKQILLQRTPEGVYILDMALIVFSELDPFQIYKNRGLKVELKARRSDAPKS